MYTDGIKPTNLSNVCFEATSQNEFFFRFSFRPANKQS